MKTSSRDLVQVLDPEIFFPKLSITRKANFQLNCVTRLEGEEDIYLYHMRKLQTEHCLIYE